MSRHSKENRPDQSASEPAGKDVHGQNISGQDIPGQDVHGQDSQGHEPSTQAASSEADQLRAQLHEKEKELAELKDKYLRTLAEGENARKRIRQQTEESIRIQREELLRDLLAIIDNLERAVDAARGGGNGKPIVEGIEMVLRSMHDLLRSHGVTAITAVGKPFDPLVHEAVDHVETEQYEPNTVIKEFHRGYQIGDRLLRPARVSVSKALDPQGESGDQGGNAPDVEKP